MSETVRLSNFATIANAVFNSVTANSTAIQSMSVGGTAINATAFAGTANNANNLGGVAAASYQLNSTLAANVATMTANAATFANSSSTNTFTVGTAAYFVANGNLGIGTTSPGERLHVAGDIQLQQDIPEVKFVSSGNVNRWYVGANISDSINGGLCFGSGSGVGVGEFMRITSGGNLGIGTTSPSNRLHVVSTANSGGVTLARFTGNSSFNGIALQSTAGTSSNITHNYIDSINENNVAVGNIMMALQTDGGSAWTFETTPPGSRSADRRQQVMALNSSGHRLNPLQPYFLASIGFGNTSRFFSGNGEFAGNVLTVHHNLGNHYNNSNGRFTAPVTGRYLISFHFACQGGNNGDIQVFKNGSGQLGGGQFSVGVVRPEASPWENASMCFVAELNANDFISLGISAYTNNSGVSFCMFSAMLIG